VFDDVGAQVSVLVRFLEGKDDEIYAQASMLSSLIGERGRTGCKKEGGCGREKEREDWVWEELAASERSQSSPARAPSATSPVGDPAPIIFWIDQAPHIVEGKR
jgi:hypothetical protein